MGVTCHQIAGLPVCPPKLILQNKNFHIRFLANFGNEKIKCNTVFIVKRMNNRVKMSEVTTKPSFDPSSSKDDYNQSAMQFFNSFEAENEATALMNAQLTPEENLMKAHKLFMQLHEKDCQKSKQILKEITFVVVNGIAC